MSTLRLFYCTTCHTAYICPADCQAKECVQCKAEPLQQVNPFAIERSGARKGSIHA